MSGCGSRKTEVCKLCGRIELHSSAKYNVNEALCTTITYLDTRICVCCQRYTLVHLSQCVLTSLAKKENPLDLRKLADSVDIHRISYIQQQTELEFSVSFRVGGVKEELEGEVDLH